ncbi:Protein of unknown function [Micromonospora coriariae]|uniref:DUF4232 domain-containing protein n=1 Tax=Micromonospora coriariae TaxID=285665 RepID=A0A1C4W1W2_9ACTN|nr:DUF4232 domain-containing protein [Micromonospora coriariae]SCE90210.1 Protein of unknown function [Micromonospora coriariae]
MASRGTAARRTIPSAAALTVLLVGACAPADHRGQAGDGPNARPGLTTAASPTPSAYVSPPFWCPESGVRIRSTGSDAAMGLRALGLELVNCGDRPYRVKGYPAPRVLDEDRKLIILRVLPGAKGITPGFDQPPREVTLQAGERATAVVLWRNLVTDSTVVATNGEYLRVAPAAGQPAEDVDPDGPIDVGNTGRIGVSAWKKADPYTPVPTRPAPPPPPPPTPDSRL